MSNRFYEETLLKRQFILVARLQKNAEFLKYVSVSYEERNTREAEVRPVDHQPSGPRYPEKYIVEYKMPVYVAPGQLRRDWHGTATMLLSESVLMNKHSNQAPHVTFHSNFAPFNNHVARDWICVGDAWTVARANGLWHFIMSLGAIINQDASVSAHGPHLSEEAYNYWVARDRTPVTDIKWPFNLLDQLDIVETKMAVEAPPITITQTVPESQASVDDITKVSDRLDIRPKPSSSFIVITPKS